MKKIILKALHEQIKNLPDEKNIFVLKGVPLAFVDEAENLEAASNDPLNYFFALTSGGRKFLSYEEFLLLKAFILAQYSSVCVLKNNLFMEQFPIEKNFGDATKKILLEHFTEPENDTADPQEQKLSAGNEKIANIFVGLKESENLLVGVYNDEQIFKEAQVNVLNLFESAEEELSEVDSSAAPNFIDLKEEADYVEFVRQIISSTPEKIFVRTHNYVGDKEKLNDRLKILLKNFAACLEIFRVRPEEIIPAFKPRIEFTEILKKHWGYDAFRDFKVYDRQKLYAYDTTTGTVSQEKIISDIVEQVELRMEEKISRDVFVTAPTGAGKSVIFQVSAIYLAEKYKLLTIVISPLIALMNDQVKKFKLKNYRKARTINSETSPIMKDNIVREIANGECDILYISPETLMSRNDIEQLVGERKIGLIAIDEAHIVATWGKEFRPDYWYMGDRIQKMRKKYSFIIATFTATAIYRGPEDMYWKIIDMLHMSDPITYLGYVKRDDIEIKIDKTPFDKGERAEFELEKFPDIEKSILRAKIFGRKTLIYFPEVQLVATYHAKLWKGNKQTAFNRFTGGQAWVMMATKAFGMGIDIDDIKVVMHFAPTGNVCDYVQEIGRAARRENLRGEARYHYNPGDFKYVKFFHRMAINKYQLIDVIKKICEIYRRNPKNNLVLDADNFSYIFYNSEDEDETINKVKISLLIIQKDLEAKFGFPPIIIRPWPLYSKGFFKTDNPNIIQEKYGGIVPFDRSQDIYCVNLKYIWENNFRDKTFPQFKRMIYSKDAGLPAELQTLQAAYIVTIEFKDNYKSVFKKISDAFELTVKKIFTKKLTGNSATIEDLRDEFAKVSNLTTYKAQNICEIFIASMDSYELKVFKRNPEKETFSFYYTYPQYFRRFKDRCNEIFANTVKEKFYITGDRKEFTTVLGILEAMGVLNFDITGGSNNQLCLHINQISILEDIIGNKNRYSNKILEETDNQRKISLKMLKHIYENPLNSSEIWKLLEEYFIGKIPNAII